MLRKLPYKFKQGLRRTFRVLFGIDLRFADLYDLEDLTYKGDDWYVRRLLHFERLLAKVEHIDGNIVDCGVGPGTSLFAFAMLTQTAARPRRMLGYDTFRGLPEPSIEDGDWNANHAGAMSYTQRYVRRVLQVNGLPRSFIDKYVTLVPGEFKDTLPYYSGGPIVLIHMDIDFYESYKAVFKHLWPHVVRGGVVAFDEYGAPDWPGATRAVDEFVCERAEVIVKSPVIDRYYVVKQCDVNCGECVND